MGPGRPGDARGGVTPASRNPPRLATPVSRGPRGAPPLPPATPRGAEPPASAQPLRRAAAGRTPRRGGSRATRAGSGVADVVVARLLKDARGPSTSVAKGWGLSRPVGVLPWGVGQSTQSRGRRFGPRAPGPLRATPAAGSTTPRVPNPRGGKTSTRKVPHPSVLGHREGSAPFAIVDPPALRRSQDRSRPPPLGVTTGSSGENTGAPLGARLRPSNPCEIDPLAASRPVK